MNADRDKFVESVYTNVGDELNKIGLALINVNVTDIQDESGYIKALGQEAAAKAINDAKVKVAKEVRLEFVPIAFPWIVFEEAFCKCTPSRKLPLTMFPAPDTPPT